ncbi:aspartic endopeptidase Pep1/aspergillopepsin F [Aulographum hederae CBS 113979]|uniref:Aspartic endopeptidase Pep1/aspergillopepsin F n=1 Tax=Aulographum hederae CBS 113979 TaxID=1176131 RepID=A0A6G1H040_9PEZI|nr:aspartic endopeptidase Pep1/aspergillopepsin F [Aulographum hederae CBS 113979]
MLSLNSVLTFLALAGLTVAGPVNKLQKRSHFSINQKASNRHIRYGPVAMHRAYAKWGGLMSNNLIAAAQGAINGSVPAIPEQFDVEYLSPVMIGDKELMLDFDTGSADLWVFSSLLPRIETGQHAIYTPNEANTMRGSSWRISYGDSSGASGLVFTETVKVGEVTATRQAVEAATSISAAFVQDEANDGLLGLAFSDLNQVRPLPQKTFFDNVKESLEQPLFTVTLKKGAPGTYDFGWIDKSKYTGEITYVDVDSREGHWQFKTTELQIGDEPPIPVDIDTIPDTGTSLFYLPRPNVDAYYRSVKGSNFDIMQQGYTVPCDAQLPDLTVTVGGAKRVVSGRFINYAPVSETVCFGGLQPNTGMPFSIFGDVFLKSQFAVFEFGDKPRVGFAQQA